MRSWSAPASSICAVRYLTAGAVFQTVWNGMTERPPDYGIRDYDLVYHDASDLSWEAEDRVIRRAARAFSGLEVPVEVRNEARVHLWYEAKFGVPVRRRCCPGEPPPAGPMRFAVPGRL